MFTDKHQINIDHCRKSDSQVRFNPLTAGPDYIRFFIFLHINIKYHILKVLNIKCDINQQDLKMIKLNFVKYE